MMTTPTKPVTGILKAAVSALLGLSCLGALAQQLSASLRIGDLAPPLQVGHWIQGDPVTSFHPEFIYIVEFWATWCGPCKAAIPHLNALQNKYRDRGLLLIGQNVWEKNDALVAPFVREQGERMAYRIALDDKSDGGKGPMAETWLVPAGRKSIPTAFLVDRQKRIAWIGHSAELTDELIERVLANRHDLAVAARDYQKSQQERAQWKAAFNRFADAREAKQWIEAEAAVAQLKAIAQPAQQGTIASSHFALKVEQGDAEGAYRVARESLAVYPDDTTLLNVVAWLIATSPVFVTKDMAWAEACAKRAVQLTAETNLQYRAYIDTQARIYFVTGRKKQAIDLQEKVVALTTEKQLLPYFEKTLAAYRADRPDLLP